MNLKIAVPVLALTHALVGVGGFFFARSLLVKDPAWVAQNQAVEAQLGALDAAAGPGGAATPPAGFVAGEHRFEVQSRGMSRVSFTSDAPLEQIVGTTTAVSGELTLNAGALEKSKASVIKVAVGTLKTGIDKRDEHLQGEGGVDTARYPDAEFTLTGVDAVPGGLWPGRTATVRVRGTLTIKGHSKAIETTASVAWVPHTAALDGFGIKGDLLRVKARFDVTLADVGMSAEVIGQKVAEVVAVDLNLTLVEQT